MIRDIGGEELNRLGDLRKAFGGSELVVVGEALVQRFHVLEIRGEPLCNLVILELMEGIDTCPEPFDLARA